ncbi:hypothetical protein ABEB36_002172 [Hypothenemus hampei]|uniref:Uncharacterized protein n=1 Tax=Hypothenemus hampei TaxID=57062 RepID=A0ABD1F8G3_HYPHA
MEKRQETPQKVFEEHRKRRSSLKLTDTMTEPLAPRRVSFARSSYVKVFADDGQNNTLWDNTYEEEIISQTESNRRDEDLKRTRFGGEMSITCLKDVTSLQDSKSEQEEDLDFTCMSLMPNIILTEFNEKISVRNKENEQNVEESKGDIACAMDISTISFSQNHPSALDDEDPDILIDSISLNEENGFNITTHPKVTYSEPKCEVKYSTSLLHFPSRFSSESKCATLTDDNSRIESEYEPRSLRLKEFFKQRTLNTYTPIQDDTDDMIKLYIKDCDKINEEIKIIMHNFRNTQLTRKFMDLEEEIKKISSAFTDSSKDTTAESPSASTNPRRLSMDFPRSLQETIVDDLSHVDEQILKLEEVDGDTYTFSVFGKFVWFKARVRSDDGQVIDIECRSGWKEDRKEWLLSNLHQLITKHIMRKLQNDNLRLCLGNCFDILSLKEYVIIVVEKTLKFHKCNVKLLKNYPTLELDQSGLVTFQCLNVKPPIMWIIKVQLASIEEFNPQSLTVQDIYGKCPDKLKNHVQFILRNNQTGVNCVRHFVDGIVEHFQMMKTNNPMLRK